MKNVVDGNCTDSIIKSILKGTTSPRASEDFATRISFS